MNTDLTVILPILTLDEKEKDMFANAIESIKTQKVLPKAVKIVIPKNEELKKEIESFDFDETIKDMVSVIENDGETDFCSQVNLVAESVDTEWFSILEVDDVYSNIWFDNFVKYTESYEDVDVFLPIVLDVNTDNQFIHFTNEPVWAKDFSEKLGYLDNDALLNFPNFQLSGAVIRTEVFNSVGGLKGGVKMFFNYELLLRMTYYDSKIMVIPKIGYKKVNMREGSLFWRHKNIKEDIIDPVESRFWYNTARKECYFKKDRGIKYEVENVE
jgi:hypothetical protein